MMFDWPKILAFTITYSGKDYVYEEFKKSLSDLQYPNIRHIWIDNTDDEGEYLAKLSTDGFEAYHVERGNNSREALARSQEFARRIAVEEDYDYLLSIESDILFPKDAVFRLLANDREVVGARYDIGPAEKRLPCITVSKEDPKTKLVGSRLLTDEEVPKYTNNGLKVVNGCGMGFTLIAREVFTKLQFTYYPDLRGHSDIFFHNDVWKNGWRVYCDTDVYCIHKNVPWSGVADR